MCAQPPAGTGRRQARLLAATAAVLALCAAFAAQAHASSPPTPRLLSVHCYPHDCAGKRIVVETGERVLVRARNTHRHTILVRFHTRRRGHFHGVRAHSRSGGRLIARVPADAASGSLRVRVRERGAKFSNHSKRIVVKREGGGGATPSDPPPVTDAKPHTRRSPFDGSGMWIWYVSKSDGGNVDRIIARARKAGLRTIFIKSSDSTDSWSQFNPQLVSRLKRAGLNVCAWQYVYGNHPTGEAQQGIAAVRDGADCLVIDAESEYEGKYAQAQTYMRKLRAGVGDNYPIGLAAFPYVDYHPAFPYSVFLGPGGAQFNVPQMYWHDIGVSVATVFAHTWPLNRAYGRPIYPLGQLYNVRSSSAIKRFRSFAQAYGAPGVSWWDWQEASSAGWRAISAPLGDRLATPSAAAEWTVLRRSSKGDLVVWAQQLLRGAGAHIGVDGDFGPKTRRAVRAFQRDHELPASGAIDAATWPVLLKAKAAKVSWRKRARGSSARASAAGAHVAHAAARSGPPTASLPAKRNEIRPPWRR